MKKIIAAVLCLLALTTRVQAQQGFCGNALIQKQIDSDPVLKAQHEKYWEQYVAENKILAQEGNRSASKTTADVVIPVVFHVIVTESQLNEMGDTAGVYDRIDSQLEVINEDFSATNSDISGVPTAFQSLIGDANISFAVARINPQGKAQFGVEFLIKPSGFTGFSALSPSPKRSAEGGMDPWDNTKYLNVWVTPITAGGGGSGQVLGYAFNADYAQQVYGDKQLAGVVMHNLTLGRRTSIGQKFYTASTDKGRTLTHELGHFFNIWHIWGNTQPGTGGNCNDDDGIDDTPRQQDANFSCPLGVKANCTLGSHPGGEMYMNFMDYSGDRCVKMFTVQQVARMRAEIAVGGTNRTLTEHPELTWWPSDVSKVEYNNTVQIGPNPGNGHLNIFFVDKYNTLDAISVTNMMGQIVKKQLVQSQVNNYSIDISNMPKGMYVVHLQFDEGTISRKVVVQ